MLPASCGSDIKSKNPLTFARHVAVESYITHVRVTEDAAFPSSPPPPNSPPENKKRRVIMIAVRRTGRVRMHKARENGDGTFSIGKTWVLDDLTAIQAYDAFVPRSQAEQQHKEWASNVGFIVTLGKSYYWQTSTAKEKNFFISSLVRVYKKYTGGKVPTLIGLDDRELQQVTGYGRPGQVDAPQIPPRAPVSQPSRLPHRPQSPSANRMPSQDALRETRRRPPEDPALRFQRSRDQIQRPSTGQSAKAVPPPFGSQQTPPTPPLDTRASPQSRPSERLGENRGPKIPSMPFESKTSNPTGAPGPIQKQRLYGDLGNDSQSSFRSFSSRDGRSVPESRSAVRGQDLAPSSPELQRSKDGLRPSTPGSNSVENQQIVPSPVASLGQKSLNESAEKLSISESLGKSRDGDTLNGSANGDSVILPPALRPGPSKSIIRPVPLPASETPEDVRPSTPNLDKSAAEAPMTSPPASSPSAPPSEPAEEDKDAHRPGLGPMVKKKSGKDIAGAFRKAATAYGAFKPRPGGAGERLLAAAAKAKINTDEPDGITGVVPAPSLRAMNEPRSPFPETPINDKPFHFPSSVKEPPTLEITQAPTEDGAVDAAGVQVNEEAKTTPNGVPDDRSARSRSVSPSASGARRRRREDDTAKYCEALGIDPGILDGRGVDFDDTLTSLGWNGRLDDDKRIEDLEADVRREIGRVEATSWLGNLEQQEGKVDHLARLIDKTIEECEELDGLLTLYSHELNVGFRRIWICKWNQLANVCTDAP